MYEESSAVLTYLHPLSAHLFSLVIVFCYSRPAPPTLSWEVSRLCMKSTFPSVLPGCSLLHRGFWACRQSLVHHCLLPGHSLSVRQTAGSSSSSQGLQAAQWSGPNWRREVELVNIQNLTWLKFQIRLSSQDEAEWDRWESQADHPFSQTYMQEFRSQISSCPSLTAPNTVAHLGDHSMSHTALWVEVKLNTGFGWSCLHSWMVQSEEQLKNTSALSGHHVMLFTGHWEAKELFKFFGITQHCGRSQGYCRDKISNKWSQI